MFLCGIERLKWYGARRLQPIIKTSEVEVYDFLTLPTSTEKLLTRAGFELAPSRTLVRRSTS